MSESTIRARIASVIGGVVLTPQVHDHGVTITSEEDVNTHLGYGTDTEGRATVNAWVVFPASVTSRVLTATCGYREAAHTFSVYGYRSMTFGSEAAAEDDANAITAALLTPSSFNTLTPAAVVTEVTATIGPAQVIGVTVWEIFLTVVVTEYLH